MKRSFYALLFFSLVFLSSCNTTGSGGGGTSMAAVQSYAAQNSIDHGHVKVHYLGTSGNFHHLGVRERPDGASNTFPGKIFKVPKDQFHPAMEYPYTGSTSRMARAF